jgi:hypothetical protein
MEAVALAVAALADAAERASAEAVARTVIKHFIGLVP